VRAAQAATKAIPIVFVTGADPVALGFAASLNRPGGNLTGVASLVDEIGPKRLELSTRAVADNLRVCRSCQSNKSCRRDCIEGRAGVPSPF
jgi:putative tryptophan/tyrosine transport system substrate-binding protein